MTIDWRKGFLGFVEAADSAVVGRVLEVETQAPAPDGFLSTVTFAVEETLHGTPGADVLTVRLPSGQDAAGRWYSSTGALLGPQEDRKLRPGDRVLLLLSRALYEEQSARGGTQPLPSATGAGLGAYRLSGDRIHRGEAAGDVPATLSELRARLRADDAGRR
ncbi:MAG: hypothetical protein ACK40O_03755 [Allosphingosinicella sp.]